MLKQFFSHKKPKSLRQQFLATNFILTTIGVCSLLLVFLLFYWFGHNTNALFKNTIPFNKTVADLEIGVQKSLAALRGWVSLGQEKFLIRQQAAWKKNITPNLKKLITLTDKNPQNKTYKLARLIETELASLKSWQWRIADIAQTPGNYPAKHFLNQQLSPVANHLLNQSTALIEVQKTRLATQKNTLLVFELADFRGFFTRSWGLLEDYIFTGDEQQLRSSQDALERSTHAYNNITKHFHNLNKKQKEIYAALSTQYSNYQFLVTKAIQLRQSDTNNMAVFWLKNKAAPLAETITQQISGLGSAHSTIMHKKLNFATMINRFSPYTILILTLLMLIISYVLAIRKSNKFIQPLKQLLFATKQLTRNKLQQDIPVTAQDELGELTHQFNQMRAARQLAEAKINAIFDTAVQAMIVIDQHGIIQQFNPSAEKLFMYKASEIIHKNVKLLMPHDIAAHHDHYLSKYMETKKAHIIGLGREVTAKRKDGSYIYIFLSVSEVKLGSETYFAAVIHDLSETKALQDKNQKLTTFSQKMMNVISYANNYKELIITILRDVSTLFNFDVGHFYEYKKSEDVLTSSTAFYLKSNEKYQAFKEITLKTPFKKGAGLPGTAWKKNKLTHYKNIYTSPNFPRAKYFKPLNLTSGLAFPVTYNKELLGVMEFFCSQQITPSKEEKELLNTIAKTISVCYGIYTENRDFNLIFNTVGEGIIGLDSQVNISFTNPFACNVLGYLENELISISFYKLIKGKNDALVSSIKRGAQYYSDEQILIKKDGTTIFSICTCTPTFENKKLTGTIITFSDITEKIKLKKYLSVVSGAQESYIKGEKVNVLYNKLLDQLLQFTNSTFGFIGIILQDKEGRHHLKTQAIINMAWDKKTRQHNKDSLASEAGFKKLDRLFQHTVEIGDVVISNDPKNDQRLAALSKEIPNLNAYLGVPIYSPSGLVAMFGIANAPQGYTKEVVDDLKPLVNALSSIIESHRSHTALVNMAKRDPLTNAYNRGFFEKTLHDVIITHQENQKPFCLLMLDLNKFKDINDQYGHEVGDKLLIAFYRRISSSCKSNDIIARLGGDEFIVILQNLKTINDASNIANRILFSCKEPYVIERKKLICTTCAGLACYPDAGKTSADLIKHADFALYTAKRSIKKLAYYTEDLGKKLEGQRTLEYQIEQAFAKSEFYLVYQPQVDITTHKIIGFELLMRWHHPIQGEVLPENFIPTIEKMGLSKQLNAYIIQHALRDIKEFTNASKRPIMLAINISPVAHQLGPHIKKLLHILEESKIATQSEHIQIVFEMTESIFSENDKTLKNVTSLFKQQDVIFAIDDFGMKYSSLNRLLEYPFDILKIDQAFIKSIPTSGNVSSKSIAIIKAIFLMSKEIGFAVIAEGVETKAQVETLKQLGCRYLQGHYFYEPLSKEEMFKLGVLLSAK